jgi:hypothetical protein
MKVNEHNLLEALKKLNFDPKIQPETNQIFLTFEHEGHEFPIFIRPLHDGELIQLLTFVPCSIDADKLQDVARFLHMLNKELDVPGFCMDEQSQTIFYRVVLPSLKKEFHPESLEALLNTSQVICKSFGTVIEALAIGALTLQEIIDKARSLEQENRPKE